MIGGVVAESADDGGVGRASAGHQELEHVLGGVLVADRLLHRGHPRHAANENHLVDVGDRQVALFERGLADLDRAGHKVGHDLV